MPANYDRIDLWWSWRGDLQLGTNGDLADTSPDEIQGFIQLIMKVVASSLQDWEEHPSLGVGLDDFIGEPNTRDTARRIQQRVRDGLILFNIVREDDLAVRVVPVGSDTVMIVIRVAALSTSKNSLEASGVNIALVFDYRERGIFFLDVNTGNN